MAKDTEEQPIRDESPKLRMLGGGGSTPDGGFAGGARVATRIPMGKDAALDLNADFGGSSKSGVKMQGVGVRYTKNFANGGLVRRQVAKSHGKM